MPNRLIHALSPYLRQHADNPVDWHPWDNEALQLARESGKPILLSIGYSACHWCHVMAHESFEDQTIAALMNEHFINIKVDREERPDLDRIYQLAQQIITRHGGGWPLTMFLTHDTQQPFFGGTYFPPVARQGMPGFGDLLVRVAGYYQEHRDELKTQGEALEKVFNELHPDSHNQLLDDTPLQQARDQLATQLDSEFGGFSGAPKFPHPRVIECLLQHWRASSGNESPDLHALYMAALTLTRMSEGGLRDQLAGGFFRYSVDRYWMIPHFEKMLYDNAELLRVYSQAALATGDTQFEECARSTVYWLLSEMRDESGLFWSSLDADSEGHEGKFYAWDAAQVARLLNDREYAVFSRRFGLDGSANFEGRWHLHGYRSVDDIASELQLARADVEHCLQHATNRLLAARNERVRPGLDDKLLTSWNALTISALAQAARALDNPSLADVACNTMDALLTRVWRDHRLYAVHAQGQTHLPAYLDDHAFLLDACMELLQTRWRDNDLALAITLADTLLTRFMDQQRGSFYFTADDHETLIHRSKSFADEALPAGAAIATFNLQRLGYLLAEPRYLEAAEQALRAVWPALLQYPSGHCSWLPALRERLSPTQIVIIRSNDDEALRWQRSLDRVYQPHRLVLAIPSAAYLPPALASKETMADAIAYVCQGTTCSEPVRSLEAVLALTR